MLPKAAVQRNNGRPRSANRSHSITSSAREHGRDNLEQSPLRLEIDDQFKPRRLFDRQIGRLSPARTRLIWIPA
jgi:hypothetical protein